MNNVCAKFKVGKKLDDFHKSTRNGYRSQCKTCKKISDKMWREENKEKCIENSRDYYDNVKGSEEFRKRNNNYMKESYKKKPYVFIQRNMLKRHLKYINSKKITRTTIMLGYTPIELKNHLEYLFKEGTTCENYGEWHVDHIKPMCKFDRSELPSVVNALENLQPLWTKDNLIKGDKYE